jgi:hypothetical protein
VPRTQWIPSLVRTVDCLCAGRWCTALVENDFVVNVARGHGRSVSNQCCPMRFGFIAALRGHFSSSALLFHSLTVWGFCRLDRPGGSGSASGQSLALWPFVAFRNCFSAAIGETTRRPNQSMKPTALLLNKFGLFATPPCVGLSLSR